MRLFTFQQLGSWYFNPLVLLFALFTISVSVSADTTLEILHLKFPEKCGAVRNQEISSCPRCHASPSDAPVSLVWEKTADNNLNFRTITSLEKEGRITVFVPVERLKPGQPFIQLIRFKGNGYFYQYGYRKDRGPFHELDSRWIHGSPKEQVFEEHDGTSLPLLNQPGEYVFMVKLLYGRHATINQGVYRWEEVVLLWPISVNGED